MQFARPAPPRPDGVDLPALLGEVAAGLGELAAARRVRVEVVARLDRLLVRGWRAGEASGSAACCATPSRQRRRKDRRDWCWSSRYWRNGWKWPSRTAAPVPTSLSVNFCLIPFSAAGPRGGAWSGTAHRLAPVPPSGRRRSPRSCSFRRADTLPPNPAAHARSRGGCLMKHKAPSVRA